MPVQHDAPARLAAVAEAERLIAAGRGPVHLLGIGGVGMAGLAAALRAAGLEVTGCDGQHGETVRWLQSLGIPVHKGHDPSHLEPRPAWMVRSPAVRETEPEVMEARRAGIPVLARGFVLPAVLRGRTGIAVAGTHGKTTTTAMTAHILRTCGIDASFCVGGIVSADGAVAAVGRSRVMVVEADESDGTLALYESAVAVVTNVELDHVDYFRDEASLHACFGTFVRKAGCLIHCAEDPGASVISAGHPDAESFGLVAGRWQARGLREEPFAQAFEVLCEGRIAGQVSLNLPGRHNVLNALAAVAASARTGVDPAAACRALASYRGVRRRFEIVARAPGRVVISDYAHHPTEIRALMTQVMALPCARRIAIFQPHRFTRTAALGPDFARAFGGLDLLVLAPTYAAFEDPVAGGAVEDLARLFEREYRAPSWCAPSLAAAWERVAADWRDGDVVLLIGAGDVDALSSEARRHLDTLSLATEKDSAP